MSAKNRAKSPAQARARVAPITESVMSRVGTLAVIGLAWLASACASTGAVPQPFPTPGNVEARARPDGGGNAPKPTPGETRPAPPVADGYAIAGTALALRGSPYRNGGSDPAGFDCSGFVWYVFAQHGIRVPRTVTQQFNAGLDVTASDLRAGDLVFFSTEAPGASHVGMVIGGDEFVHAPSSNGDVRVERITARYWSSRFVGARRLQ
jgi:cell wall-associated NlpC family hydrolase